MDRDFWTYYDSVIGRRRRYRAKDLEQKFASHGFTIERVCARDDRMDGGFGVLFGASIKLLPAFTCRIVKWFLPGVASK
jgi:hypothetical protein